MGKEEIFNYVMETPGNTNPNVLRSLLNNTSDLPPVTPSDNGKVLTVADGAWAAQNQSVVLYANVDPLTLAITAGDNNPSYDEITNKVYAGGYSFVVNLSIIGSSLTVHAYIQPEMPLNNTISFVGQYTNFGSSPITRYDIQFRVSGVPCYS